MSQQSLPIKNIAQHPPKHDDCEKRPYYNRGIEHRIEARTTATQQQPQEHQHNEWQRKHENDIETASRHPIAMQQGMNSTLAATTGALVARKR